MQFHNLRTFSFKKHLNVIGVKVLVSILLESINSCTFITKKILIGKFAHLCQAAQRQTQKSPKNLVFLRHLLCTKAHM